METPETTLLNLKTISRTFHELCFKENTRITEKTLQLAGQYIQLFINEAIVRSNDERLNEIANKGQVDGIDNVESVKNKEHGEVEEEVPDFTIDETFGPLNQMTQLPIDNEDDDNNNLDARHLSKVAGVLILDF